ncbi:MAG: hypothetical protein KGZ69_16200 [Methylomonas sp.]|nr:hypothetical protein [Methylomonas sp.]
MGLKSDIDEVRIAWPTYPWRLKAWLILSVFLASGSIASLSDVVFRWKGFILEAVLFYRDFVSEPFRSLISSLFSLPFTRGQADIVILSAVFVSALMRVFIHSRGIWYDAPRVNSLLFAFAATVWVAFALAFGDTNRSIAGPFGAFLVQVLICTVYYSWRGGATRVLWYVYMLTPFVLVCLLAAVNSGLRR